MKKIPFSVAIAALADGMIVRRAGWNGKDMFLFLRPHASVPVQVVKTLPDRVKEYFASKKIDDVEFTAYICMKAADDSIVNGWLASQTDMLANDWEIIE